MMHADCGEHNSFSKFAMGFIEPYVAEDIEDEITIRMSVSEDHDDVILIPTSKGWNGSAFDEYILIDICAPIGAAGYDWGYNMRCEKANVQGGVRVYHVDARLTHYEKDPNTGEYGWVFIEDPTDAIKFEGVNVNEAFCNTLSVFPVINGKKQSNYYHLIEIISSAGTSHYRSGVGMGSIMIFDTSDLFAPGQTFRADNNHAFSFSGNSAVMNNGGSFDYSVSVLAYDPVVHEAVVTIKKLTTE